MPPGNSFRGGTGTSESAFDGNSLRGVSRGDFSGACVSGPGETSSSFLGEDSTELGLSLDGASGKEFRGGSGLSLRGVGALGSTAIGAASSGMSGWVLSGVFVNEPVGAALASASTAPALLDSCVVLSDGLGTAFFGIGAAVAGSTASVELAAPASPAGGGSTEDASVDRFI